MSGDRKAITFHSLRQARAAAAAAVETGLPVILMSAPSAAASAGPGWFTAVVAEVRSAYPDADVVAMLDCGAMPGYALGALRHGLRFIRYDGPSFEAIAEIARQYGGDIRRERPDTLDLGEVPAPDDEAALRDACCRWLTAPTG